MICRVQSSEGFPMPLCLKKRNICHFDKRMMYICRKQRTRAMKTITNPERLVSVPFSKTRCGVDFYINTGESKDICGVLTEHRTFKTDFFSFYFFRRANGYVLLNFRKIELRDDMVLLLSPHQQQEWHVDEAELDYTFLIFPRRLYAHVHRRQVLRLSPAVLLSDRHATVPVCRAGRTVGIYAPLGEDKTGAAASCGRHLQPYRICALLSVGGYQPGIRQNLPSAGRSAEEQLCLPIQRPVGETYPRHAACSGICRYTPREPYHSEQFCNGAVRRVRHPSAQTTLLEELKNELLFSDRNVSQLADEFHFSDPSHLMRFFKQQTGKTFTQYITDYQKGIYE